MRCPKVPSHGTYPRTYKSLPASRRGTGRSTDSATKITASRRTRRMGTPFVRRLEAYQSAGSVMCMTYECQQPDSLGLLAGPPAGRLVLAG